jgi:peptidoglycan hydrolase-like protein with peptidoglycan-binding domain
MSRVKIIKRGATGGTVKWIQARAGGGLVVDGIFGAQTETRIKELQAQYALTADGIVGIDTLTLLSWFNPAPL